MMQTELSRPETLICCADIKSPIADAIPDDICGPTFCEAIDYTDEQENKWDGVANANVIGQAAINYLIYDRLFPLAEVGKKIVTIGGNQGFNALLSEVGLDVHQYPGKPSLNDQDFALELRDDIATNNVGALVLVNQDGKLRHLKMVEAVPIYRGSRVVMNKTHSNLPREHRMVEVERQYGQGSVQGREFHQF